MMKTNRNAQHEQLDAILLQGKSPNPNAHFMQNVWRQIRCTEPEPAISWSIPWLHPVAVYAAALILVTGALYLGRQVGQVRKPLQTEIQISVLQPQTLAGTYLTVHSGK